MFKIKNSLVLGLIISLSGFTLMSWASDSGNDSPAASPSPISQPSILNQCSSLLKPIGIPLVATIGYGLNTYLTMPGFKATSSVINWVFNRELVPGDISKVVKYTCAAVGIAALIYYRNPIDSFVADTFHSGMNSDKVEASMKQLKEKIIAVNRTDSDVVAMMNSHRSVLNKQASGRAIRLAGACATFVGFEYIIRNILS